MTAMPLLVTIHMGCMCHYSHGIHVSRQGHLLSHQRHALHTGTLEGGVDDKDEVVSGEAVSDHWEGKQDTGRAPIQQRTCTVRVINTSKQHQRDCNDTHTVVMPSCPVISCSTTNLIWPPDMCAVRIIS